MVSLRRRVWEAGVSTDKSASRKCSGPDFNRALSRLQDVRQRRPSVRIVKDPIQLTIQQASPKAGVRTHFSLLPREEQLIAEFCAPAPPSSSCRADSNGTLAVCVIAAVCALLKWSVEML